MVGLFLAYIYRFEATLILRKFITLLSLIFAGLNFRDSRDLKKIAELKTREQFFEKINHAKFNILINNSLIKVKVSLYW